MQVDKGTFKKMFPRLAEEIDGYNPTVIDFLRRCDTAKQAEEIIDYLEKRGEIDNKYAQKLKAQLKKKGVRSFGAKREEGYYLSASGH
jgi:hypothetical protein